MYGYKSMLHEFNNKHESSLHEFKQLLKENSIFYYEDITFHIFQPTLLGNNVQMKELFETLDKKNSIQVLIEQIRTVSSIDDVVISVRNCISEYGDQTIDAFSQLLQKNNIVNYQFITTHIIQPVINNQDIDSEFFYANFKKQEIIEVPKNLDRVFYITLIEYIKEFLELVDDYPVNKAKIKRFKFKLKPELFNFISKTKHEDIPNQIKMFSKLLQENDVEHYELVSEHILRPILLDEKMQVELIYKKIHNMIPELNDVLIQNIKKLFELFQEKYSDNISSFLILHIRPSLKAYIDSKKKFGDNNQKITDDFNLLLKKHNIDYCEIIELYILQPMLANKYLQTKALYESYHEQIYSNNDLLIIRLNRYLELLKEYHTYTERVWNYIPNIKLSLHSFIQSRRKKKIRNANIILEFQNLLKENDLQYKHISSCVLEQYLYNGIIQSKCLYTALYEPQDIFDNNLVHNIKVLLNLLEKYSVDHYKVAKFIITNIKSELSCWLYMSRKRKLKNLLLDNNINPAKLSGIEIFTNLI